jgi:uncharacterized DUF497 family protein
VDSGLELRGQTFVWDSEKAALNLRKHNVNFQEACEVFFGPFFRLVDATAEDEAREGAMGYTERSRAALCCACGAPGRNNPHHFGQARNDGREKNL